MSAAPACQIREALDHDLPALAAVHRQCFEGAWPEPELRSLRQAPGALLLAAFCGDAPLGLVLARQAADEAEILTLAVIPAMRRHGIARDLMMAAGLKMASGGARHLFLEVGTANKAARGLYAGLSFVPVGLRPGYYGRDEDALILRAALPLPV